MQKSKRKVDWHISLMNYVSYYQLVLEWNLIRLVWSLTFLLCDACSKLFYQYLSCVLGDKLCDIKCAGLGFCFWSCVVAARKATCWCDPKLDVLYFCLIFLHYWMSSANNWFTKLSDLPTPPLLMLWDKMEKKMVIWLAFTFFSDIVLL